MLQRLDDGNANVYHLVLCVKIDVPSVSANLSLLQITNLASWDSASATSLFEVQWSPSDEGVVLWHMRILCVQCI